jgi:hypothetical protein
MVLLFSSHEGGTSYTAQDDNRKKVDIGNGQSKEGYREGHGRPIMGFNKIRGIS